MPAKTRFGAPVIAAIVVVSAVAPAFAGVAAAGEPLAVETAEPTNVTETTAALQGDLTSLGNASSATVSFRYWATGDAPNASTVDAGVVNESGAFEATIDGLSANTTYTVVAAANGSGDDAATGDTVTFTTDDAFDVRTDEPTDVNRTAATLRGTLIDLDGATNATVWFEYWRTDGNENVTATTEQTTDEAGAFVAAVDGLEPNATYAYVAYAQPPDGEVEVGDEVTFDTGGDAWEDEDRPFGQRVAAFVHALAGVTVDGSPGTLVSDWVVSNNPAADNRPDHAGPDGDGGPPVHANGDDASNETRDEASGASSAGGGDGDRGPPDHAKGNGDGEKDEQNRGNGKR